MPFAVRPAAAVSTAAVDVEGLIAFAGVHKEVIEMPAEMLRRTSGWCRHGAVRSGRGSSGRGSRPTPVVFLGLLGVVALVLAVIAIVTAAQWALLGLTVVVVALWAGTTLRHAVTPLHPLALH